MAGIAVPGLGAAHADSPWVQKMGTAAKVKAARGHGGSGSSALVYHGGAIVHTPAVYVVFWGSQWASDPSGERSYLTNFLSGLTASTSQTWSTSTTQYCSNIASGLTSQSCTTSVPHVGALLNASLTTYNDTASAAPSSPSQSQLAAEASKIASQFGVTANSGAQVVVATAHGASSGGFGTQYCAWHSSTTYLGGSLAYTNLPYITDAGASCGADFVNSGSAGANDGISIVEGHELAESLTDPYPTGGWLDGAGAENADKCAWIAPGNAGGAGNLALGSGSYAVQSLWSDLAGGCVISS